MRIRRVSSFAFVLPKVNDFFLRDVYGIDVPYGLMDDAAHAGDKYRAEGLTRRSRRGTSAATEDSRGWLPPRSRTRRAQR
jgi:hypothetical protein